MARAKKVETPARLEGSDEAWLARLQAPAKILAFMLAGNAYFTIRSVRSGTRFTYRVAQAPERPGEVGQNKPRPWFVSVLTGANNEDDYTYLGAMWPHREPGRAPRYSHGTKSKIGSDAPSAVGFLWLMGQLAHAEAPNLSQAEVWHEGRCGRCGRKLTVPESVEAGIGPDCAEKMAGGS